MSEISPSLIPINDQLSIAALDAASDIIDWLGAEPDDESKCAKKIERQFKPLVNSITAPKDARIAKLEAQISEVNRVLNLRRMCYCDAVAMGETCEVCLLLSTISKEGE